MWSQEVLDGRGKVHREEGSEVPVAAGALLASVQGRRLHEGWLVSHNLEGGCLLIGQTVSTFPNECSYCSSIYIHFERVLRGCLQVALFIRSADGSMSRGFQTSSPPQLLWPQNRALKLHPLTFPIVFARLRSASSGLTAESCWKAPTSSWGPGWQCQWWQLSKNSWLGIDPQLGFKRTKKEPQIVENIYVSVYNLRSAPIHFWIVL